MSDRISRERICGYIPFFAKVVHIYGEIQNLPILSYLLWFLFSVGGYFKHVVYYVIIEALVAPKRKIKKVYLSFWEIPLQNQGQWMLSFLLKPMLSVTSNI